MAQMTVPTLATWCAVYTIADQSSDPYLSYVLHEDEDRIDGLKALLSRSPRPTRSRPPAPGSGPPRRRRPLSALRASLRSLGLGESSRPAPAPATLATAAAVGGETVVLPLVARNRVIGMLTLGKPVRRTLPPGDPRTRRGPLPPGRPRPRQRPPLLASAPRSASPCSAACCRPAPPTIPGVEVEVIYRAAGEGNEVGGDFYDVFPIRDGATASPSATSAAPGPEAAAVTGLARHALRLLAREGLGGPAVLERLNAAILDEGARSRFLTLLYGELWPQQRRQRRCSRSSAPAIRCRCACARTARSTRPPTRSRCWA